MVEDEVEGGCDGDDDGGGECCGRFAMGVIRWNLDVFVDTMLLFYLIIMS